MTNQKTFAYAFIFLFLSMAFFLALSSIPKAFATENPCSIPASGEPVVHVWPSGDGKCTDLRAAVNSANSYTGDERPVIIIHQGSYFLTPENDGEDVVIYKKADESESTHGLVVKRPLIMKSNPGDKVVIDVMGAKRGIIILSDDVRLEGFMIANNTKSYLPGNTEAGIYIYQAQNVVLNNITVFNNRQSGVIAIGSQDNQTMFNVTNSSFYNNSYDDIELVGNSRGNVINNLFYDDVRYNNSITFFGPSYAYIFNNTFYKQGTAIRIYDVGNTLEGKRQRGSIAPVSNKFKDCSIGIKIDVGRDVYHGTRRISPLYNFDWDDPKKDFVDDDPDTDESEVGAGNVFDSVGTNCLWGQIDVWDTQSRSFVPLSCNGRDCTLSDETISNFCRDGNVDTPNPPDVSYPSSGVVTGTQTTADDGGEAASVECLPLLPPRIHSLEREGSSYKLVVRHRGWFGCNHELVEHDGEVRREGVARKNSIIKACLVNAAGEEKCEQISMEGKTPGASANQAYLICGRDRIVSGEDCEGDAITLNTSGFDMSGAYLVAYSSNGTHRAYGRKFMLSPIDYSRLFVLRVNPPGLSTVTKDTEFSMDIENRGSVDIKQVMIFIDRNVDGRLNARRILENCGNNIGKWCSERGELDEDIDQGDVVKIFCSDSESGKECNIRNARFSTYLSVNGKPMIPENGNFKLMVRIVYEENTVRNYDKGYWYTSRTDEGSSIDVSDYLKNVLRKNSDNYYYGLGFTKQIARSAFLACGDDVSRDASEVSPSSIRKALIYYYKPTQSGETTATMKSSYFTTIDNTGGFIIIPLNDDGEPLSGDHGTCIMYHKGVDVDSFSIRWKGANLIRRPRGYIISTNQECGNKDAREIESVRISSSSRGVEISFDFGNTVKLKDLEEGTQALYHIDTGSSVCDIRFSKRSSLDPCAPRDESGRKVVHVYESGDGRCTNIFSAIQKAREYCNSDGVNCENRNERPTIIIHDNGGKTEYQLSQPSGASEVLKLDFPVTLMGTGRNKVTLKFTRTSDVPDINISSSHVKIASINLSDETSESKGNYSDVIFINSSSRLSDIKLSNIFVTGEHADDGVYAKNASLNITNSVFYNIKTHDEARRIHSYGIILIDSEAKITNTQISQTERYGIYIGEDSQANITNTQISQIGVDGIYITENSQANITNVNIYNTGEEGITVTDQSEAFIDHSTFAAVRTGIWVESGATAWVTNSRIGDVGIGIKIINTPNGNGQAYIYNNCISSASNLGDHSVGIFVDGNSRLIDRNGNPITSITPQTLTSSPYNNRLFNNNKNCEIHVNGEVVDCQYNGETRCQDGIGYQRSS